jgi:hypothetical protein
MDEADRQAAATKVTISNGVATAALAVIAGAAALYTYVSQTFEPPATFQVLMLIAVVALVVSIVLGGLGSNEMANRIATGADSLQVRSFNTQALLTLAGLLLVLAATAVGASSERHATGIEGRIDRASRDIGELRARLDEQSRTVRALRARVARLAARRRP